MRKIVKMSIAAAMIMGVSSISAQADGIDIVSNVKVKGEIRARYENVDQDNGAATGDANAYTNRLTIGASADLLGTDWLSAYAEMTNVSNLNDNYNDGATNPNSKDLVKDPAQTRLTQSYIDLKMGKTMLRAGRQMMNIDNQRFVGAVGWRQMPQTFDAITLTDSTIENLNLFASYVTQVNTVALDGSADTRDLLLNASYKVMPELKATVYAYMLGSAHDTYGVALTGDVAVSDGVKVNYRAEYATQTDATLDDKGQTNNAAKADASYYNLELGVSVSGVLAGIGYESMSGDDGSADSTSFKTPYATLHGKNGWADTFLGNDGQGAGNTVGIEDMSVYIGYKSKELGLLKVVYHDFSAEVGSADLGSEIDAIYTRAIPGFNNLTGMLKYADYDADTYGQDTKKFWAMLDYKFATK